MRKRILPQEPQSAPAADQDWLDLESLAQAELSSEDEAYPIESALKPGAEPGWRASQPGKQTIRLLFDTPQKIQYIHLEFDETERPRTQEFVLRWSSDGGRSYREIVRQQYNLSPPVTHREVEDYTTELEGLTALELDIIPDISGGPAHASVSRLLLA